MPICKNCKKRIERFNKDRCPICGVENPFEGVKSETIEITTNIDVDNINLDYHPRTKKKLLFFFMLIGFTGMPFFYIRRKSLAFTEIAISVSLYVLVSILLWWFTPIYSFLCGLIALGCIYLVNIIWGLIYTHIPNLKDGQGEFVN